MITADLQTIQFISTILYFENCFIIYFVETYQKHVDTLIKKFIGIAVRMVQVHLVLSHIDMA